MPEPNPDELPELTVTQGDLTANQTLGALLGERYKTVARLGAGAFGEVFRARDGVLGRDVAVKIVPRELAQGDIVAGLCREAMALDKLSHRAFPRVLECDYTADGSWYMVEEFIEGERLSDTFSRAPLDP